MAIAQADGYEAVFKLPDGSEAALPVIVWSGGVGAITGLVNQADLEALLGKRFNYGIDYTGLVTPCGYPEFQRYRKAGLERCETQDEPKTNPRQT
ncbi:hypothetical protein SDC9_129589 [bioreactor metagenome]|uniref:Uncharacterized protein n=1 Tax=bioreactor metagenome TaxID=1076179 RepID=A0A645D091_9ZZZZ